MPDLQCMCDKLHVFFKCVFITPSAMSPQAAGCRSETEDIKVYRFQTEDQIGNKLIPRFWENQTYQSKDQHWVQEKVGIENVWTGILSHSLKTLSSPLWCIEYLPMCACMCLGYLSLWTNLKSHSKLLLRIIKTFNIISWELPNSKSQPFF